jgi:hypothetical protein
MENKKEEKLDEEQEKKLDKEVLSDIFGSILSAAKKENEENYGAVIGNIKSQITSPDDFNMLFYYPLKEIVEAAVCQHSGRILKDRESSRASFIINNYEFVENNIEKIIVKFDGSTCSADKSGCITHRLFRHFVFNEEINVVKEEKAFWIPNFWNDEKGAEWLELLEALIGLYYGDSVKYLLFMKLRYVPLLQSRESK